VRPENVLLHSGLPVLSTGPGFEVRLVERFGSACLVTLEHDGWRLAALVPPDKAPAEGQRVTALPDWDCACLFDVSTGRVLSHGASAR
jgi:hypothetical protein